MELITDAPRNNRYFENWKFPKPCRVCKNDFMGSAKKQVCFDCKKARQLKAANERNHRIRRVDRQAVDNV